MNVLLRHTKRRLLSLFQSCDVNSRKMTKDKRVVMDFRHLNMHIVKNTFSMLGSSKCEVMSVLDLKDVSISYD